MVLEDVARKYDWNPWYFQLRDFAASFIDDAKAKEQAARTPDQHIVFMRLGFGEFPRWIQDALSPVVQHVQVFAVMPHSIGMIHKDGHDRKCALNVPLPGADKGIMEWYTTQMFDTHVFSSSETISRVTREEVAIYPEKWKDPGDIRTVIERPTLVNTDVWHRIDNSDNPDCRYVLSLRFKDNPTFNYVDSLLTP